MLTLDHQNLRNAPDFVLDLIYIHRECNFFFTYVIGSQVHRNIGFSIKDIESHKKSMSSTVSIVMMFI